MINEKKGKGVHKLHDGLRMPETRQKGRREMMARESIFDKREWRIDVRDRQREGECV